MVRTLVMTSIMFILAGALSYSVDAASVEFRAEVSDSVISMDDSVSLKLLVETDGSDKSLQEPTYTAKGMTEVNSYDSSYVQSTFTNGKFQIRKQREVTKVLRPKNTGKFKIENIQVVVDGKVYRANPVTVEVTASGPGTPPPRGYGGTTGLRGAQKSAKTQSFFLRAELSKPKIYKGEQLVVSYYIYSVTKVFNMEVTKYPILNGFLRKDLSLPIRSPNLNFESVVLDGISYRRALLARYAAYPLKKGKLRN